MSRAAKHPFRNLLSSIAVASIILLLAGSCAAQDLPSDPTVDNGTHWYGSYDGVHENISLSSGNLSFCIPLVSLKGPNKHDLSIPFCYNSQFQQAYQVGSAVSVNDTMSYFPWVWAPNTPSGDTTPPMGVGWSLTGHATYYPITLSAGPFMGFIPDGGRYSFSSLGGESGLGPDLQNADIYLVNGVAFSNSEFILKDGSTFTQAQANSLPCGQAACSQERFTDGSAITWTANSITDAIGRTVTETSGSTFSGSNKTSSTAYIAFQYPDPVSNGATQTVTVQMQSLQFSCSNSPGGPYDEVGSGGYLNSQTLVLQEPRPTTPLLHGIRVTVRRFLSTRSLWRYPVPR